MAGGCTRGREREEGRRPGGGTARYYCCHPLLVDTGPPVEGVQVQEVQLHPCTSAPPAGLEVVVVVQVEGVQ